MKKKMEAFGKWWKPEKRRSFISDQEHTKRDKEEAMNVRKAKKQGGEREIETYRKKGMEKIRKV
jgi:hypothetical protein